MHSLSTAGQVLNARFLWLWTERFKKLTIKTIAGKRICNEWHHMTMPFWIRAACLRSQAHSQIWGEIDKTPGKGQLPKAVLLNCLQAPTISTPVFSCNESSGCYIGKSISLYASKFVLSKILSSSWLSSMINMLRSTVQVDQPLMYNSLTQALSRHFNNFFLMQPHRPHLPR